jgi:hypothetical protein
LAYLLHRDKLVGDGVSLEKGTPEAIYEGSGADDEGCLTLMVSVIVKEAKDEIGFAESNGISNQDSSIILQNLLGSKIALMLKIRKGDWRGFAILFGRARSKAVFPSFVENLYVNLVRGIGMSEIAQNGEKLGFIINAFLPESFKPSLELVHSALLLQDGVQL